MRNMNITSFLAKNYKKSFEKSGIEVLMACLSGVTLIVLEG